MEADLRRISKEASLEEGLGRFEAFFSDFLEYLSQEFDSPIRLSDYEVVDGIVQPPRAFYGLIDGANVYMPRMLLKWQIGWRRIGVLKRMEHPPARSLSVHYGGLIPLTFLRDSQDGSLGRVVLASEAHFSSYEGEGPRFLKHEAIPFPFSKPPYDS